MRSGSLVEVILEYRIERIGILRAEEQLLNHFEQLHVREHSMEQTIESSQW